MRHAVSTSLYRAASPDRPKQGPTKGSAAAPVWPRRGLTGLRWAWSRVASAPVCIGSDVFIGARAVILKGGHIGDGAVIGAASLITRWVMPRAVTADNPARVSRSL